VTVQLTQAGQGCQSDSVIDRGSRCHLNAHLPQNHGTLTLGGRRTNYRLHLRDSVRGEAAWRACSRTISSFGAMYTQEILSPVT
jgi:hypothetical protein